MVPRPSSITKWKKKVGKVPCVWLFLLLLLLIPPSLSRLTCCINQSERSPENSLFFTLLCIETLILIFIRQHISQINISRGKRACVSHKKRQYIDYILNFWGPWPRFLWGSFSWSPRPPEREWRNPHFLLLLLLLLLLPSLLQSHRTFSGGRKSRLTMPTFFSSSSSSSFPRIFFSSTAAASLMFETDASFLWGHWEKSTVEPRYIKKAFQGFPTCTQKCPVGGALPKTFLAKCLAVFLSLFLWAGGEEEEGGARRTIGRNLLLPPLHPKWCQNTREIFIFAEHFCLVQLEPQHSKRQYGEQKNDAIAKIIYHTFSLTHLTIDGGHSSQSFHTTL